MKVTRLTATTNGFNQWHGWVIIFISGKSFTSNCSCQQ